MLCVFFALPFAAIFVVTGAVPRACFVDADLVDASFVVIVEDVVLSVGGAVGWRHGKARLGGARRLL